MDLVGRQIGNYVAKQLLGRGGMGVVYLAEHPLIGRKVAVKVLHEELAIDEQMVQRLWLEAKSASEIDSEHIVDVLDFGKLPLGTAAGETRETVYFAMELLEGQSLADRFWGQGLTFRDSVDIARQVCRALEASHDKGIVHRDLKPENVFLVDRPEIGRKNFVKILDFGIAKLIANPYMRTRTGVLLGTPAYMSPEQCRGTGDVDHRADVYALGVVLYELVCGKVPFAAQGFGDVLVAQMMTPPEPPSTYNQNVPKSLEAAILCALQKKAADRFQSMAAFGAALAGIAEELDRAAEAYVQGRREAERTTERDPPRAEDGRTLVDPPPDAGLAAVVTPAGLHDQPTQALKGEGIHQRQTAILDGDLHGRTTKLHDAVAAPRPSAPIEAPVSAATSPSGPNERIVAGSLREALGSTGALRQLESELAARGAAKLPPDAPTARGAAAAPVASPIEDDEEPARSEGPKIVAIVAAVVLLAAVVLMLLFR